jgi:ATP-dependent helicase/DNAse subunit B
VPEVEEGLSPLEKGYILHGALFEFFVERRTNKLPRLRDCSDREFRDAVERLTAIVRRRLEEVEIHDVFWEFDREQLLGSPTTPGILHSFLEFERRRDVAAVPRYFEVSFGRGTGATVESDPLLPWPDPISLGGVCLRGKVDRIDIAGDRFAIIDYKTGRAPTPKERELGISVQLAVYLAAMEAILTAHAGKPMKAGAGVFLQLRESVTEKDWLVSESAPALLVPEKKRGKRPTDEEFRREIDQAIGSLQHSIEGIVAGRFPLTTEEKVKYACTWCDFSTACRIRNREWIERPQSAETR